MNKIKEEQLNKIKEQQTALNNLLFNIGNLEAQKHALLHDIAQVNLQVEEFKKELEKEYGSVNINLETGEYEAVEEKEEETPVAHV